MEETPSPFLSFLFGLCREPVFVRELCMGTYCRQMLVFLAELHGMQISSSGRYKSHRQNGFSVDQKAFPN